MSYKQLKLIWNKLLKLIWWVKGFIVLLLLKFVVTSFHKSFIVQNNVQLSTPKYFHCKSHCCCFYASTGLIFSIFSTARVFSCSRERVSWCNEVSGCENGGWVTTEKSAHLQRCYSEVTIPAAMDDFGWQNKKSCEDNGKKPRRVKIVLLYQVIPGFTPGLKLILIFTSRFCFTDDSNSRNGECETGYRSTGKFIIHHCFFFSIMRHFRVVLKKYPNTMSENISVFRKTSSSFRRDSNNTTQALRSKSEEVNLTTLSLFIVCLPPYLFTPGSEFNWQSPCYLSVYLSWNMRATYLRRQIPLLCNC